MIEPTDEIRRAYSEAWFRTLGLQEGDVQEMVVAELRDPSPPRLAAIAAALAIAERQWQEQYGDAYQAGWWRGQHELCPRCGVELERDVREEQGAQVTEYTVSALPEGDINGMHFQIKVAYRGRGLWAVSRHRYCLSRSGEWDYESVPSERTDEWLAEHRFPLDEALRLAREELPRLCVNGMTAADVKAWAEQRRATPPQ